MFASYGWNGVFFYFKNDGNKQQTSNGSMQLIAREW